MHSVYLDYVVYQTVHVLCSLYPILSSLSLFSVHIKLTDYSCLYLNYLLSLVFLSSLFWLTFFITLLVL